MGDGTGSTARVRKTGVEIEIDEDTSDEGRLQMVRDEGRERRWIVEEFELDDVNDSCRVAQELFKDKTLHVSASVKQSRHQNTLRRLAVVAHAARINKE